MDRIGGRVIQGVQVAVLVALPSIGANAATRSSVPSISCNVSEPFISYAVSPEGVLDSRRINRLR